MCVGDIGDRRLEDWKIGRLEDWKIGRLENEQLWLEENRTKKKKTKKPQKRGVL